jgi:hypothetical protein
VETAGRESSAGVFSENRCAVIVRPPNGSVMNFLSKSKAPPSPGTTLILSLAFFKVIFHLAVNALSAYGYFRDKF